MSDDLPIMSTNEVTPVDNWHWRVHYDGGEIFYEYENNVGHGWAEVFHNKVNTIEMIPQTDGYPKVMVDIPPGCIPFFRRKRNIGVRSEDFTAYDAGTFTELGWYNSLGLTYMIMLRSDGLVLATYRELK